MLVADLSHQPDALGRVEAHPTGALHDRLDDHARKLTGMAGGQLANTGGPLLVQARPESVGRAIGEDLLCSGVPANRWCIPPTGSQTAMAPAVSP